VSLGNFSLGSVVRLPLHIVQDGGIPVTSASNVSVTKIILPNATYDANFPRQMLVGDSEFAIYYLDYKPSVAGNYLVIYTFDVDGVTYSSFDSFYISSSQNSTRAYARPVSFISN
jgi:hypothetical protein